MSATLVYRPFAIVLTLAAVGAVAVAWTEVVRTLSDAKPAPVEGHASAIVWNDRVFQTASGLKVWLRSRGAEYADWRASHPRAAAVLEHRSLPAPASSAASKRRRAAAPDPARARSGNRGGIRWGRFVRPVVLAVLLLVALLCAWCAMLPTPLRRRYPELAQRLAAYREALAATAAAVIVAVIVGVALS